MAPVIAALGAVGGFLAANAGTISTIATIAGGAVSAAGSIYSGQAQAQAANAQAKAMKQKGEQELAIAQRRAMETRRQKRAAMGRTLAVAAASGGGTGDTVSDIMTGLEARGEYNALTDLFNGKVARNDLFTEAALVKQAGKDAKTAGWIDAGSTLLNTAGTVYSDYGRRKRAQKGYDYEMGN